MKNVDKEGMLRKYKTTFAELSVDKVLSPIVGMGMVSLCQAAEYLGCTAQGLRTLRQKFRKDMDALGMIIVTAREIVGSIPGAVRYPDGSYDLPLEDGSTIHVTGGKYTYFTAAAVKRLVDEVEKAVPSASFSILSKTQTHCCANNTLILRGLNVSVFDNQEFGSVRTIVEKRRIHGDLSRLWTGLHEKG